MATPGDVVEAPARRINTLRYEGELTVRERDGRVAIVEARLL